MISEISRNTSTVANFQEYLRRYKEHDKKTQIAGAVMIVSLFVNPVAGAILLPEFFRQAVLTHNYAELIVQEPSLELAKFDK